MDRRERARLESHLRACPGCTLYLAQMRTTMELTGRLRSADVDALGQEARTELLAAFRAYRAQ
jgi:hypothetical protein